MFFIKILSISLLKITRIHMKEQKSNINHNFILSFLIILKMVFQITFYNFLSYEILNIEIINLHFLRKYISICYNILLI